MASGARHTPLNGELRRVFEVVESRHVDGDRYVQEAATRDLQKTNVVGAQTPARCLAYLDPASLHGWREVERFWNPGAFRRDT